MSHVALLGDSIFDNARYVPSGSSVIEHLRKSLPSEWQATLLAVDGAGAEDVARQWEKLPGDVTHVVVSVGGNNALDYSGMILREPAGSFAEVLIQLGTIRAEFQQTYRQMLDTVRAAGKPTAICTIYDSIPNLELELHTGLCVFNDVILREAARGNIPVIDLRAVCNASSDYAASSPIEPSSSGGLKIARAVSRVMAEHDFIGWGCRIYCY